MEAKFGKSAIIRLEDLTPDKYKCTIGHCPSVYKTEEGKLLIVGKKLSPAVAEHIAEKIGDDEWAIIVDPELLSNI